MPFFPLHRFFLEGKGKKGEMMRPPLRYGFSLRSFLNDDRRFWAELCRPLPRVFPLLVVVRSAPVGRPKQRASPCCPPLPSLPGMIAMFSFVSSSNALLPPQARRRRSRRPHGPPPLPVFGLAPSFLVPDGTSPTTFPPGLPPSFLTKEEACSNLRFLPQQHLLPISTSFLIFAFFFFHKPHTMPMSGHFF